MQHTRHLNHPADNVPPTAVLQAAEAIGVAVGNLVSVGTEAMGQGDEQLKSQMPAACEQISAAGRLFADATVELKVGARWRARVLLHWPADAGTVVIRPPHPRIPTPSTFPYPIPPYPPPHPMHISSYSP